MNTGYHLAYEALPKEDADWMIVFVELDGSIWYGSNKFAKSHFSEIIPLPELTEKVVVAVLGQRNAKLFGISPNSEEI